MTGARTGPGTGAETRSLLLVHGWGFDASVWDPLLRFLPGRRVFRAEAGYLGAVPDWPAVPENTLLVGHSAGVATLLLQPPPSGCAGLVAINGFTRFAAVDGFPGVADRVLARMERNAARSPDVVLQQFRTRCSEGADAGDGAMNGLLSGLPVTAALAGECLLNGLGSLRTVDARPALRGFRAPVLVLAARNDPIVTPAHTEACFDPGPVRWSDTGGHLLPLTRPDWCAAMIDGLA